MADRFPNVFVFDPTTESGEPLDRVRYETPPFDEAGLQEILRLHPKLLAIDQIEPIYAPAICIGREVALSGWPIDNLYISPAGYITIVETKLWKNPEGRREVVAQVIEYSKELAKRSYSDIEEIAARYFEKYHPAERRALAQRVADQVEDFDEQAFIDSASRCLRSGRFLLLIVGEGIRESAADLVEHVNTTPELGYNLNLVELGCYKLPPDSRLILVPRVIARTVQIERAVVRIEMVGSADTLVKVQVSTPPAPTKAANAGGQRITTPSADEFYDRLTQAIGATNSRAFRDFVGHLEAFGVISDYNKEGVGLWYQPNFKGAKDLKIFYLLNSGKMSIATLIENRLQVMGLAPALATNFWNALHEINAAFPPVSSNAPKYISFDASSIVADLHKIEQSVRQFIDSVESNHP